MNIADDLFKLLCDSPLKLEAGDNGQSVSDDMVVLRLPKAPSETNDDVVETPIKNVVKDVVKLLGAYIDERHDDKIAEVSPGSESLVYFLTKSTRAIVGGVSVVQYKDVLTLWFLDA